MNSITFNTNFTRILLLKIAVLAVLINTAIAGEGSIELNRFTEVISPLCIESVTYQHVYYIHLLIVFILNAPFGDLYRLVMLFLIPVNII
jgi:hypothetical protein